jgi:hypothetical protein
MIVAELLIKRVISPSYVASCFDQFGPAAVIDGMMRQSAPCAANKQYAISRLDHLMPIR